MRLDHHALVGTGGGGELIEAEIERAGGDEGGARLGRGHAAMAIAECWARVLDRNLHGKTAQPERLSERNSRRYGLNKLQTVRQESWPVSY